MQRCKASDVVDREKGVQREAVITLESPEPRSPICPSSIPKDPEATTVLQIVWRAAAVVTARQVLL